MLFKSSYTQFRVSVVIILIMSFLTQDEALRRHRVNTPLLHVSTLCLHLNIYK